MTDPDIRVRLPLQVAKLLVELGEEMGTAGELQPGEAKAVADARAAIDLAVARSRQVRAAIIDDDGEAS